MYRMAVPIVATLLLAGSPQLAQAQSRWADFSEGQDTFHFVFLDDYDTYNIPSDHGAVMSEFIPAGEDIDHWTSIYTLSMNMGQFSPVEQIRESAQAGFFALCQPGGGRRVDFPIRKEGKYDVAEWLQICDMAIAGPSKGNPEAGLYKASAGDEFLYAVSFAVRRVPSDAEIAKWRKLLAQVGWK